MSKIFKKPMISNDTISLDSNEWSEIAIELNIKNSQENIHNFGNCNNKLPEFHGKDYLMLSKGLPKLDEKAVSKIEKHDKMIKEKEFFDQKTKKPGTPGILPPKANRNGHALLKYFLSCGYEFALNEGIPYFYFDETGVWYPLTTLGGSCRFMSTLSDEEKDKLENDTVNKLAEAIPSSNDVVSMQFKAPPPNYINFKDAVFDVYTEKKLPHSSRYMFTYCINATTELIADNYCDGLYFSKYLGNSFQGNQERVNTLGEIFGVAISNIRDQKQMFFLYGPSSSGKSVALNILNGLICDEFVSSLSFRQFSGKFELSEMAGSCLNLSSEIPAIKGKTADVLKRITGNDPIHAERKGTIGFRTRIHAMLVFATNILPQVADDDEAFYSRFRVLKYDHSIPKSEWIKDLEGSILENELGYVLRFAIEGLKQFISNGMEISAKEESDSYVYQTRIEENSFTDFASRYISVSDGDIIMNADLYVAYHDYCRRNYFKPLSAKSCSHILKTTYNAEADKIGHNRDRGYRGIRLCYNSDNACL